MENLPENTVTTDLILGWLKDKVEAKKAIPREVWLSAAFKLNLLQPDEVHEMEVMRQEIAKKKLQLFKEQEKRNVAAVELEIQASDEYRLMREQENKVDRIEEFIRIAKKNSETAY